MVLSDLAVDLRTESPLYWLCRAGDHSQFAYARVGDFYRASDHVLWAQLRHGWLVSALSGRRLAFQVGHEFYDAETHQLAYVYETHP
jgi:hypothetical protein